MPVDAAQLRSALAGRLPAVDPAWRAAVEAVPRELFFDGAFYRARQGRRGTEWEPVVQALIGDDEWLALVYEDSTWVTQIDGADADWSAGVVAAGDATSSSTLPSLVVRTLEAAGIRDGDRVLEIGTGTGYSTALLSHRLGEKHVTSVEVDRALAARAAAHLAAAGYVPRLIVDDGLDWRDEETEFDRLVATCSVRSIPTSWLWQVRAGGTIAVTLSGWMMASGLLRLTVGEDGGAQGSFTGEPISYMLARPHGHPPRPTFFRHEGEVRPSRVNPVLLDDRAAHLVAQLAAPSAELLGSGDEVTLLDVATGSLAWTEAAASGDGWSVHQYGPLRLWDQVETALAGWQKTGSPPLSAFGVTVTPDMQQSVWMGDPEGPSWRLPA
ncbi:ATP-grasp peptide maturase system methyltransferase [Streptomyces sp. RKAG293]|uniref:ATP-grasp peptide maturase system methyltransferase n=1 Tax=Streptomyces sp. RKAG293 TaxID=2893403 RepID=UPI0020342FC0|nr:ATP-grasp peptide maturase system methyltransferase [Streptomyces sp. RKAG293]MCM2420984.1 ATP-grasp peptide maturase system methyltransferase [Streptomyces sp. RKAG293]